MARRLIAFLCLLLLAQPALAEPWTVGQQTIAYTYPHVLGDGSNSRGGEAPAYAYEAADVPTSSSTVTQWTHTNCTQTGHSDPLCGEYATSAQAPGGEAKARFDCNVTFQAFADPILGTPTHEHDFFGNTAAEASPGTATYSSLRSSGNSTCYGGPLNRTLYWEPSLKVIKNGVAVSIKPRNLITYYNCGNLTTDPAKCSRYPRGLSFIGGIDTNDPTNLTRHNRLAAIDPSFNNYVDPLNSNDAAGFTGWQCMTANGTGHTAYGTNSSFQPYLNDGAGHHTLDCQSTTIGNFGTGIIVNAQVKSPNCWDGVNLTSPNGRSHVAYAEVDHRVSGNQNVCPDGWYKIPQFIVIVQFVFKDAAEMDTAYLSSDRMDPNPANWFKGGQTMHFDAIFAWHYGTGDNPGVMLKFFQHCLGITMHVKNSDGSTYTDLTGDPHECGYARISFTENLFVNEPSPDGSSPNPVVTLSPDLTGTNRYFPISDGTPLPDVILHQH